MDINILECTRAVYGKPNMPMDKREYTMDNLGSSVGFITEIIEYIAKPNGYNYLNLKDKDGVYVVTVSTNEIKKIKESECTS